MEKKKRSKCPTSHRKVFTVNELNPKEKVIFDFLELQYNESETIKDILYEYIITNNLQTTQHSVNVAQSLGKHSVINNAEMCNDRVNDNAVTCKESVGNSEEINNENFIIDLGNVNNEEVELDYNQKEEAEKATNNALDFLSSQFIKR